MRESKSDTPGLLQNECFLLARFSRNITYYPHCNLLYFLFFFFLEIMRWTNFTFILLSLLIGGSLAEWSWGGDKKDSTADVADAKTELLEGEIVSEAQEKSLESNATVLDDIVDELVSRKQGRSLGGFDNFDDVYGDPTIKEALDAGDDAEARNLIKGRLCSLGLVQVSISLRYITDFM